jgi:hypothetical protein
LDLCTDNRSGVASAHLCPRFARLLVSDTKSLRVKKTMQGTFVMERGVRVLVFGTF